MFNLDFRWKLLILLSVLATIAAIEWLFRRRAGHCGPGRRWAEYAVLLAFGALAAVLGASVDFVTVRISPEYFAEGKGLGRGEHLRRDVVLLGAQAGFTVGIAAGAVCLFANSVRQKIPRLPLVTLFAFSLLPLGAALAGGAICGLGYRVAAERDLLSPVPGFSKPASIDFNTVWGIHTGIYAGCAIGLTAGAVQIARRRSSRAV